MRQELRSGVSAEYLRKVLGAACSDSQFGIAKMLLVEQAISNAPMTDGLTSIPVL